MLSEDPDQFLESANKSSKLWRYLNNIGKNCFDYQELILVVSDGEENWHGHF